jgi:hypothetical protein
VSSSGNLIPDNEGVRRQAGRGGWGRSTAHAAPTVFCPLQKHYRKTRRTAQVVFSSGAKWNVKFFFSRSEVIKEHKSCNVNRFDFIARNNVLMLTPE